MGNETTTVGTGSLLGPYRIVAPLGRGGSATVFRAVDTRTDRTVALKVLARNPGRSLARRFRLEARLLSLLDHPNIVRVYELFEDEDCLFFTLDYADGSDLATVLREHRRAGRPLDVARCLELTVGMLAALAYLEPLGLHHRDIKPANVLLTATGRPLLSDFGLARLRSLTRLTTDGEALGTVKYMPPEQLAGLDYDERGDLYQVGLVLYELLYGDLPFATADTPYAQAMARARHGVVVPRQFRSALDEALGAFVERACAANPDDRFPSARAMADELSMIARDHGIDVPAPSWAPPSAELVAATSALRSRAGGTVQAPSTTDGASRGRRGAPCCCHPSWPFWPDSWSPGPRPCCGRCRRTPAEPSKPISPPVDPTRRWSASSRWRARPRAPKPKPYDARSAAGSAPGPTPAWHGPDRPTVSTSSSPWSAAGSSSSRASGDASANWSIVAFMIWWSRAGPTKLVGSLRRPGPTSPCQPRRAPGVRHLPTP